MAVSYRPVQAARTPSMLLWRIIFACAAVYNVAFGAWAVAAPLGFFELFELAPPVYLGIWSCLGMVIGVYGLGYAYIAWQPEKGDVLAALGLIGKVLGPIGWISAVWAGELPARTFPIILLNDLIWWYPFVAYLLRRTPRMQTAMVLLIALMHLLASLMLLFVREGTEAGADTLTRAAFILEAQGAWVMCWLLWVAASLGLMAFFVLWAQALAQRGAARLLLVAVCVVAFLGLCFDLTSETILIAQLTDARLSDEEFARWAWRATLFGAGFGNGYYCIAGALMSIISWHARLHRGALLVLGFAVWTSGFGLSAAAFAGDGELMTIAGALLMLLFIPWAALTGLRFHNRDSGAAIPPS